MNDLRKIDVNNDKMISSLELYLYLQEDTRKLSRPRKAETQTNDASNTLFNLFADNDKDKDGFITLEEFKHDHEL